VLLRLVSFSLPFPIVMFAGQLAANDSYKRLLADDHGELTVPKRLMAGACAGMTATALTHPLDTVRLRLALPGHAYKGGRQLTFWLWFVPRSDCVRLALPGWLESHLVSHM
jgi:hypothetical protein